MDLRIDAARGQVIDLRELFSDQVTRSLEEEHNEDVTVERDHGGIYAVASVDDSTCLLEISPVTGGIETVLEER